MGAIRVSKSLHSVDQGAVFYSSLVYAALSYNSVFMHGETKHYLLWICKVLLAAKAIVCYCMLHVGVRLVSSCPNEVLLDLFQRFP